MSDWQAVGRQKFLIADDLVKWEVLADVTVPELSHVLYACADVQAAYGYALLLVTAKDTWAFPPPARKFLSEFHRQHKAVGATAFVGASPTMTIFIDLVLRAVALVSGHRPKSRFFRRAADAMDWLDEQRTLGKKGQLAT